jgi:hypothetical protein
MHRPHVRLRRRHLLAVPLAGLLAVIVTLDAPVGASGDYGKANGCYLVNGGSPGVGRDHGGLQFATSAPIRLAGDTATTGETAGTPLAGLVPGTETDCSGYTYELRVRTVSGGPIDYTARTASFTPSSPSVTTPFAAEVDVSWTGGPQAWAYNLGSPSFSASFAMGSKNTDNCLDTDMLVLDSHGVLVDRAPSQTGSTYELCAGSSGDLAMHG